MNKHTDQIRVPGKSPIKTCGDGSAHYWYRCNRRREHTGRHAFIWWHIDGRVRAVWGES